MRSLDFYGISPSNTAADNAVRLQKAIDWASPRGAALWLEPAETPYPIDSGLILRRNVSLIGAHGPVGRGTRHPKRPAPVGSVFAITDPAHPFLTVEAATQVRGLQFWYPQQTRQDPAAIIPYPATIQASREQSAQGVTLSCLTFYGEYQAMDFACSPAMICEQILIEHCYGYPLGGRFVHIDYCYDIPRLLHCHVNPANRRFIDGDYSREMIDAVIGHNMFAYAIDHTDNAQCLDLFTFGSYGGIHLGAASYGQLTNFNFDCVTIGILKQGDNNFNRNWQIAQGSIIANAGTQVEAIHPVVIEGHGHTSLTNVEAFSGDNPVFTNTGQSQDYLLVRGNEPSTVSLVGCRMRDYAAASPITCTNPHATVQAVACVDKDGHPFATEMSEGS